MYNYFSDIRKFDIIDSNASPVDACAQFIYKGFQISMSTVGRSYGGGCMNSVCIFTGEKFNQIFADGFHTVENAIAHINFVTE